jgi:hydroxymethylglutaryl-CoA reductase (NADPH)
MARALPPRGFEEEDTQKRLQWLEDKTGVRLDEVEPDQISDYRGIIENHVGSVKMPMAVAGPLVLSGSYAQGEYYVPICTLEATLSMSMSRGLYLTSLSGGIKTRHLKQELSRSPVFIFDDIEDAPEFKLWLEQNFEQIKIAAESTTNHGKLLRIDPYLIQNSVILDFVYSTAEAAGQNMVTIATQAACQYIQEDYDCGKPFHYFIESNFNCDKNPATKTILLGRGHQVTASTLIKGRYLKRVLRADAAHYVRGWRQCGRGSQLAGVVGMNMHVSNALAAIYLATGQDVACVSENALGSMDMEVRNGEDLYASLTMPSLTVGTIGGGTGLGQQRRNLELLGCVGENSSKMLAEIVCAAALGLELSLGASVLTNEFAQAHDRYRKRTVLEGKV